MIIQDGIRKNVRYGEGSYCAVHSKKKKQKKNRFRVENTDLRVSMPEALQHLQEHQVFTLFTVLNAFVSMAGNNVTNFHFAILNDL